MYRTGKNRVNCCQRILAEVPPNAILLTSDEAHFHLTDCINKQNFRYWVGANSHQPHNEKVTVWCAGGEFGVLGPIFFFRRLGWQCSIRYICSLQWNVRKFPATTTQRTCYWCRKHLIPQDGAIAHITQRTMRYLREIFPRHIISHQGDSSWPARSADLAQCDFFLWGYLKGDVYKHCPRNLVELKTSIREEIQQITPAMTVSVMNFRSSMPKDILWGMLYSTTQVH